MCLSTLQTKRYKNANMRKRIGYKIFEEKYKTNITYDGLGRVVTCDWVPTGVYKTPIKNTSRPYRLNKEYVDKKDTKISLGVFSDKNYNCGYHIFLRKSDAVKYMKRNSNSKRVVLKVRFAKVVAQGLHETSYHGEKGPCVVAKKMKLLKLEKKNK